MNHKKQKKILGTLSAVSIVLIIAVAILANVLVSKLNWSIDTTDNQIFSISSQSKKIIKNLDEDVTIYFLSSKKNVDDSYLKVAEQYAKGSKHIDIKYRDMKLYPNFASKYTSSSDSATEGDVIVVCGDKGRYISQDNFVSYGTDSSGNYTTEMNMEPSLTSAINYVTSDSTPKIYTLTGHGELEFDSSFKSSIESDNYAFEDLNLLTEKSIPKDCQILLINAPTSDLSSADLKKVNTYMKNGGKLFYVCNSEASKLTNFEKLLKNYGIGINDGLVVETDSSKYMQGYPTYLLPTIESSTITDSLISNSSYILAPVSKGLTLDDGVTSLLTTGDGSYSKVNTKSETISKEAEDIDGPFSIAAEATDDDGEAQVVVIGCSSLISDVDQYVAGANSNFVSNCVNALSQQDDKISVKAKTVSNDTATYTSSAVTMVSFAAVVGIPLCIIIIGIIVVIVRRRSK